MTTLKTTILTAIDNHAPTGTTCDRCSKPVRPGDWVTMRGANLHISCAAEVEREQGCT